MKGTWMLLGLLVAATGLAQAQHVYKCEGAGPDGETVYSQSPCSHDAEEVIPDSGLGRSTGRAASPRSSTSPQSSQRNEVQEKIMAWCRSEWRDDYRMQEHCYTRQVEAAGELSEMMDRIEGDQAAERVVVNCGDQWTIPTGTQNFRMMLHCVNRQLDARDRIR